VQSEGAEWMGREGVGAGGEMTQALSAHMNNKTIKKRKKKRTLLTNKRGNTPKGNNNYQTICIQSQCTQFHQTYSEGLKS
jgi:hypothetical protein